MHALSNSFANPNPNSKRMAHIFSLFQAFAAFVIAAILNELVPIKGVLITTFLLVVADTITGIRAARKRNEAVTSKGLRRTIEKFLMYSIAILCANRVQIEYFGEFPLVFGLSAFIGLTELYSNLEKISGL